MKGLGADSEEKKSGFTLESPTVKYIGIGLLVFGVGMGVYSLIKSDKDKKSKGKGKLSGTKKDDKRLSSGKRAKTVNF